MFTSSDDDDGGGGAGAVDLASSSVEAPRQKRGRPKKCKDSSDTVVLESYLAMHLMQQWAWGTYSPQECQRLCDYAMKDVMAANEAGKNGKTAVLPTLDKVSTIGKSGKYSGNMHRDMVNALPPHGIPEPSPLELPYRNKARQTSVCNQSILFPHVLFAAMFLHYPGAFASRLASSAEAVTEFWSSVSHTRQYKEYPVRSRPNHTRRCIPLFCHGDGVPSTGVGKAWSKMVDLWSWGSLLVTDGSTIHSHFLSFAFFEILATREGLVGTYEELWRAFTWSLLALYTGKWPHEDHNRVPYAPNSKEGKLAGTYLAGGWFCALWVLMGDLDYMHKQLYMRHFGANMPCSWCPADSTLGSKPWSDYRLEHSVWMRCIYSSAEFIANLRGPHPLFSLPGVTGDTVWADYMHSKFMGVDQYFLASVLVICVFMMVIPHCSVGAIGRI